ncbi:BRCA1-associated protein [Amborella trichopoda]|uniref:BRCA1-associated protein n=1 Tax=Amborella trichopoda TaxID=13333 RepID=U5D688_AMBTC|nr:BRCA1-associated protein [Amborella trichopoda]ERN17959.1 hypothetical protein AMTR_s00046p00080660 [Amborella trichopoda]|eukprot:XP_006856492.1 BRCA1-associated protein [Amborella trichopoda]
MFTLSIHSVEIPFSTTKYGDASSSPTSTHSLFFFSGNPRFQESKGIIHLFRNVSDLPASPDALPEGRSTLVCVLAVPNHITYAEFFQFSGSFAEHMLEMRVIRNDGMDDRYSVLVMFENQNSTDGFFRHCNGRRFSSVEAEVCHVLFTSDVRYTDSIEIAETPPKGLTELPTCPVCLERLDQDISGILTTMCNHSFHGSCTAKWTNSSCPVCRFCQQQPEKSSCSICETLENLWICIICGFVGCGRYKEGHAIRHWKETQHCYSLDLENQRVWDYVGDKHVHRLIQSKTDGKLVELNSHCGSVDDECGSCEYSGDSGVSAALFNSKFEAIVDEYNHLLANQLESQRQYYESLLVETKEQKDRTVSAAAREAVNLKLQEMHVKLDKCSAENRGIADANDKLMKKQEIWKKKLQEIEEREKMAIKERDEKIMDLEEQVRDFMVYIEAQKTLDNLPNTDDVKGGTLLPVSVQSPSTNTKHTTKTNRRRR